MLISRLHRCDKGQAAIEMAWTIPFLLVVFVLLKQGAYGMFAKQNAVVSARTGGWNQAYNGRCATGFLPGAEALQFLSDMRLSCRTSDGEAGVDGGARFWESLKDKGGGAGDITRDVRGVAAINNVEATASVEIPPLGFEQGGSITISDRYVLSEGRFWTFEESAIRGGYDRFLKGELADVYAFKGTDRLFPRTFPAAR